MKRASFVPEKYCGLKADYAVLSSKKMMWLSFLTVNFRQNHNHRARIRPLNPISSKFALATRDRGLLR
jgi:hypothetical protein